MKLGRAAALAFFGVLPLLCVWYLGATAYLVFHDQLLASLLTRQADMQYSYEDRIAVLRSQVERETSRQLVDHQTLSTTIRDLASRGERLEARTAALDALVHGSGPILSTSAAAADRGSLDNPLLGAKPMALPGGTLGYDAAAPRPILRLDESSEGAEKSQAHRDQHADLSSTQTSDRLAETFAAIEARQADDLVQLREPLIRAVERLRAALAETGLPPKVWNGPLSPESGIGGPFVPLPADARMMTFEQNLALLQDAIAAHRQLTAIIEQVPLRRPLPGRLEVTSPFGARLDPFYGRAAMHTGIDLMGAYGDAVRATAGGVVTVAGKDGGYGQMVEIDHGHGLVTRYAHLSSVEVSLRDHVTTGMIIGRIGSTGRATGPHLHYETRINGEPVDPARFLKAGAFLPPV